MESVKADVTAFYQRQVSLESLVEKLDNQGHGDVEQQLFLIATCNICKLNEVETNGIALTEASHYVISLKLQPDESLQAHVREFQLRGNMNYSIRIPITQQYLIEVKSSWKDTLTKEKHIGRSGNVASKLNM